MSQEKELLWIPVLTFENTENKPFTLADEKTSITVKKQGEFSLSKVFFSDHALIFIPIFILPAWLGLSNCFTFPVWAFTGQDMPMTITLQIQCLSLAASMQLISDWD